MQLTNSIKEIDLIKIKFPEIELKTRDSHKLRGYFGNLFREHSPLLSNHYEDGQLRYKYPEVQYKIIDKIPTLVGIRDGAQLLTKLFLKIKELEINGRIYPITSKNIEASEIKSGYSDQLHEYHFQTLWMALNQKNYPLYMELSSSQEKNKMLDKILVGNILSFFRNLDIELESHERLMAKVNVNQKSTMFKNKTMIAFDGQFTVNALIPEYIGLGKSVSRGFGTIIRL